MKIDTLHMNSHVKTNTKSLSNNRGSFSGSFTNTYSSKTKEEIEAYINEIKKRGHRLIVTQNYRDVLNYKNTIKEYLESVVEYTYNLNKNTSFWEANYFTTVETVNAELEKLTKEILSEERENIDIASTIDNLQGLLVDIYK